MAYNIVSPGLAGFQGIAISDTVQNHALGTIVQANDPTYGAGEFIYLKGVASTAIGSAAVYNNSAGTTTLTVAASRGPVGISMSANVASQYGWYQISGVASAVFAAAAVVETVLYATATGGSVDDAVVAGSQISGAKVAATVAGAGLGLVQLNRASMNGA